MQHAKTEIGTMHIKLTLQMHSPQPSPDATSPCGLLPLLPWHSSPEHFQLLL